MGYTDRKNKFQFKMLEEAKSFGALQSYSKVMVKLHPALSPDGLRPVYEANIEFAIMDRPLSKLFSLADVVYGAHSTGASWEASWHGIPVIAIGTEDSLNLNPLASLPEFRFVMSGVELSEQLQNPRLTDVSEDYFFLNEDLRLWKEILRE